MVRCSKKLIDAPKEPDKTSSTPPVMTSSLSTRRDSIESLDRDFISVLSDLITLIKSIPGERIYFNPAGPSEGSVGDYVVKTARTLEQAFGGLTTNLWDDPFEWTLPETLSSTDLVLEYLAEVEGARARAIASLVDDSALDKYIAMPSGEQTSIRKLLAEALANARVHQLRARETAKMLF